MKTLANCTPREFLAQTNKIRKSVASWLELTKVLEIRKRLPEDMKDKALVEKQIKSNTTAILDAILEEHPEETAELLGLLCFVDPEDLDNHRMTEFLGAVAEILNSQEVLDFFISLARLENMNSSSIAKV